MNLAGLDAGNIVGGPNLSADANVIDMTGLASADPRLLITFTGDRPLTPGQP